MKNVIIGIFCCLFISGCCHTLKVDPKITVCGVVVPDAIAICNNECQQEVQLTPEQKGCEVYGVYTGVNGNTISCECFVKCGK